MAVSAYPAGAVNSDMGRHDGHGNEAVSVAELLQREAASGSPLRLNWPTQCLDSQGGVRNWDEDEWPTGELPAMTDELLAELDVRGGGGTADSGATGLVKDGVNQDDGHELVDDDGSGELPKRQARAYPPAPRPLWEPGAEMLGRVLRGLRGLDF